MKNQNFTVATISNQVQGNFLAWARPVVSFDTIDAAEKAAKKIWEEMQEEFESRPDFGNGAIMGESVIIFDQDGEIY